MNDTVRAGHLVAEDAYAERLAFLRSPDAYPDHPSEVQAVETHISWVFLTERHAYKLKKPVAFGFVDFSTLERRCDACQEEVRLNRRLAPDVYLGTSPITFDRQGRRRIGGVGQVDDWLVRMRRLPADRSLDRLLDAGALTDRDVASLGDRLVAFYSTLPPLSVKTADYRLAIEKHVRDNLQELRAAKPALSSGAIGRTHSAQRRLLGLYPEWWDERVCDGRVVEGHGDLRPDHIYFVPKPVVIDALEFSAELRQVDVVDELSFLAMECACRGAPDVGRRVRDIYCEATNDHPPPVLLKFYEAYRACVRAKVAVLRAAQQSEGPAEESRRGARRYLEWSDECLSPCLRPLVLVLCGLSGTGKSFVAAEVAAALGAPCLQTDAIRKELFSAADLTANYGSGRYSPDQRGAVYEELERRMVAALRDSVTVVLDGTFTRHLQRERVAALALQAGASVLFVHCHCPLEVAQDRVADRAVHGPTLSDIRPAMLADQAREEEPFYGIDLVLELDTTENVASLLQEVLQYVRDVIPLANQDVALPVE